MALAPRSRLFLVLVALVSLARPGAAAVPSLDDEVELGAFIDGAAEALLEAGSVPGMTVAIVHDGRVVLARGYGVASSVTKEPVSAERTLFRIGSVSKLFLATAIMQLVEQGRLDLTTDVNEYLEGIRVPDTFPEPIALQHLMTHTAGFEEASLGETFVVSAEEVPPLRDGLIDSLPARVRPVGELTAYSNHGSALAGLVVEQVSGEPFESYLERHVFAPLGMTRTTSRQPVPAGIDGVVSTGAKPEGYFAYVKVPPAGSVSSTATDMARFMLAHLQQGRVGETGEGESILKPETMATMHTRLFSQDARVNGVAHQFFERDVNGRRAIGHGGGMIQHITWLELVPEEGVGFFASANGRNGAAGTLAQLFFDRYLPRADAPPPEPMAGAAERLPDFVGWYRESRAGVTNPSKMVHFLSSQQAQAGPDGRLLFLDGEWVETEPDFFRKVDGKDWMLFDREDGIVRRAFRGNLGASVLERRSGFSAPFLHAMILTGAMLLLLAPFLYRPVWYWQEWRQDVSSGPSRGAPWVSAALRVVALGLFVSLVAGTWAEVQDFSGAFPPAWRVAMTLSYAIPPLALALGAYSLLALARRTGTVETRVRRSVAALAGLVVWWWLAYWNFFLHQV